MTALDRLIGWVSPAWALRREVARRRREVLASGYDQHGASRSRSALAGWQTTVGGPDSDIIAHLPTLRERSRDLVMGSGLAAGALKTIRTNEIGPGLQLNAQVNADILGLSEEQAHAVEELIEREWDLWAKTTACDAERRHTFGELQALARLSQLVSGDVFALLPSIPRRGLVDSRYDLRVRLLEADWVSDPYIRTPEAVQANVFGGVEVGDYGEPIAYWIASEHPGDAYPYWRPREPALLKWRRVPAFGAESGQPLVLHVMEADRPGQRRGVPLLAPVVEALKQLQRYTEAELLAAVVSGLFTVAVTTTTPQSPVALPPVAEPDREPGKPAALKLTPGVLLGLEPGQDIKSVNPARPNAGFGPFVEAVIQQISTGLNLPAEVVKKQFNSNYSASRAAILEAWKVYFVGRANMVRQFCQPIYEAWLTEAVARGRIVAPGFFSDPLIRAAWCGAEWHGPAQGQLNPTDEVAAAVSRVENGFSTATAETRMLTGGDFWANVRLRKREQAAMHGLKPDTTQAQPAAPMPAVMEEAA